jgi:hypothetical protein
LREQAIAQSFGCNPGSIRNKYDRAASFLHGLPRGFRSAAVNSLRSGSRQARTSLA